MAFRFNETFEKIVSNDIRSGAVPFLVGGPGIGKSSFMEALAENNLRSKCFVLAANQLADKADVTGARLVPTDDGEYAQVFYPHQVIQEAIRYALDNPTEDVLLFIDEVNRTTPDVTSELLSLPTLRAIGSKKLPDNLRIACAGNDKGNVNALDDASLTRFVIYYVEPDCDTFFRVNPELNVFIKNVLTNNPSLLVCKTIPKTVVGQTTDSDDGDAQVTTYIEDLLDDDEAMRQQTNPRTITKFSEWLNRFTDAELNDMLTTQMPDEAGDISSCLQESAIAHVGNTEFMITLMLEISSKINTVSNQTNVAFTAPAVYDQFVTAQTVTDINQIAMMLNNKDAAGCLIAAMADKAHPMTATINALAPLVSNFDQNDVIALMDLAKLDKLSASNVAAFRASNTPIATALEAILCSFYG